MYSFSSGGLLNKDNLIFDSMKSRLVILIFLFAGANYCYAQQLESDRETEKALLSFQLFVDSVEQLINRHKLSFDTLYLGHLRSDTIVFGPSPNRKFFTGNLNGGNEYNVAVKGQYYFVELPNIACKVPTMTLDQRKEYVQTISRFEAFLED